MVQFESFFNRFKGVKKAVLLENKKRRRFLRESASSTIFLIPTICVYLDLCPPRRGNYRNRSQKRTNYLCCLPGSHESNSSTGSCLRIIAPQTISRLIDLEFLKLFGWLIELNRFYCYSNINKQKQESSKFAKIIVF